MWGGAHPPSLDAALTAPSGQDSAAVLKVATTIAVRYALVRRQGEPPRSGEEAEVKVLDYQAIQRRLMPLVAAAYAFNKVRL